MTLWLQRWKEPVPMDYGAPEPAPVLDGATLWVAYRTVDPDFPGWGHPDTAAYLERHPDGHDVFGVLRFDGVEQHTLGPPGEERLREHPLWGKGLRDHEFHRSEGDGPSWRWVVTFHDETLDVTARSATASSLVFATTALEAITKVRG